MNAGFAGAVDAPHALAPAFRILRRHEVEQLVGLKRSSIYLLMSRNEFPRPVRLTKSGRAVGWKLSAVEKWIESRAVSTGANPPTEAGGES
ncbi:MAG: AlpA family transcriptional regulator [Porticoccaceae bacterium]